MNPVDIFFSGGSGASTSGGLPPMPRNAGACAKVAGNHMPAQKLLNVTAMSASGGEVSLTAPGHGFAVGSVGKIRVSGANEPIFNGVFEYEVTGAATLVFAEPSGNPSSATGPYSVCVDSFDGDYYELPVHCSNLPHNLNSVARFNASGAEVWRYELETFHMFLGVSMSSTGNILVATTIYQNSSGRPRVFVTELDKKYGSDTLISETQSAGFSGHGKWPDENASHNIKWFDDQSLPYSKTGVDLSRVFFDAKDDGSLFLAATSMANGGQSVTQPNNVGVSFSGSNIHDVGLVCFDNSSTPVGFPTQYISRDGTVKLGQIMSCYHPWRFSYEGRFSTISRGKAIAQFEIPNDASGFFKLDRRRESRLSAECWMVDTGGLPVVGGTSANWYDNVFTQYNDPFTTDDQANPYYPNQSKLNFISAAESGYRAFPEPVKVYAVGDYVLISATPIGEQESSIKNTLVVGSYFCSRDDFDDWLKAICDRMGLTEDL